MPPSRILIAIIGLIVGALALGGCAATMQRNGIADAALAQTADLEGLPGARYWGDEVPKDALSEVKRRLPNLPRLAQGAERIDGRPVVEVLALSGGGPDGAFGAGLLTGWTARGDRPRFEVVTGVSAGAIIAPFAFLGPRYDRQLREVWTEYQTGQIINAQIVPGLLGGAALADTEPLAKLIARYVDRRLLGEVAREYRRGRMLLIGTTNLDAQRPVVWNMGEIAISRHPGAVELFRNVIMASAAIPGLFPPVNIPVQAAGQIYDEMHVDGGATREVFVSPVQVPFNAFDGLYDKPPIRRLYIIKNGKIAPEAAVVTPKTIPIAARAIVTLIKSQSLGDLYRIWRMADDAGAEFNFVSVPETFTVKAKEFFDPEYQKALFDLGYRMGRSGKAWMQRLPEATGPTAAAGR